MYGSLLIHYTLLPKLMNITNKLCSSTTLTIQISDSGLYTAIQVPTTLPIPTVDGVLDEKIGGYAEKDSLLFGDTETWSHSWTNFEDNLVVWGAVWSPATNRLYVAVEVTDDSTGTFDDTDPNDQNYYPWNNESIEFLLMATIAVESIEIDMILHNSGEFPDRMFDI